MLQHGAYNLLMDACYDRERFPTINEALEWAWASSQEEIDAVKFVLSRFFHEDSEGRFVQSRIDDEVIAYQENSLNNKRIAKERELKRRVNSTYREAMSTDRARSVNGSCTERERSVNEAPPKHKTVNSKQETVNKEKEKALSISIDDVMNHLNLITGKSFKAVDANAKLIKARFEEGHTVEDIKAVINRQNTLWPEGDPYRQYMRPSTLFNATKFNQYVGEIGQPIPEKPSGHKSAYQQRVEESDRATFDLNTDFQ